MIIKEYCEELYNNKFDNLEKMDKFKKILATNNILRINQKETNSE